MAGATGLEPATSGVTGRGRTPLWVSAATEHGHQWPPQARRRSAGGRRCGQLV